MYNSRSCTGMGASRRLVRPEHYFCAVSGRKLYLTCFQTHCIPRESAMFVQVKGTIRRSPPGLNKDFNVPLSKMHEAYGHGSVRRSQRPAKSLRSARTCPVAEARVYGVAHRLLTRRPTTSRNPLERTSLKESFASWSREGCRPSPASPVKGV